MVKERIAIFDIDGTVFRHNLHFDLIDKLAFLGVFSKKARMSIVRAYASWLENRGTYDEYRKKLVSIYEHEIKGISQQDVMEAARDTARFYRDRLYIFTKNLIKDLRKDNYLLVAISGSPIEIVKEFNRYLKFNFIFGTVYETDGRGRYTGRAIFEPVKDKGETLKVFIAEHGFELIDSVGVGDTESDIGFLALVDKPIAFNPNINLERVARRRKWDIIVEKKDVIYNLNDYRLLKSDANRKISR